MTNHLAGESSPYLLQHAENPVDWHPWGQQALAKAQAGDKPIFLSIGYSACHWCHVMAHESFEDPQIAEILNEHFVSIKVDREERPDLDQVYMAAVQALTGGGGWPLSVFLTPAGLPFYGGTYFPPQPRHGLPAFSDVLRAVAGAWRTRREELASGGQRLVQALAGDGGSKPIPDSEELSAQSLEAAYSGLWAGFDGRHGGWGAAPKFPQPMALEFLLRYHHRTASPRALHMVILTLEHMARGGIYDQIAGGFHRYSVDDRWLVPHFEKMLYDNAQLARVYLHAWQVTGNAFFRTIAEEILDYVIREMTDPAGGFYSAQDADSEGKEGKFFVWTVDEIRGILGDEAEACIAAYGAAPDGNFDGKNVLEFVGNMDQRAYLSRSRRRLFEAREKRVHPGRDEKVLTSWNGLMLAAFAEAASTLDRDDYRKTAEKNADFLLRDLWATDGRLLHAWKDGTAKVNGFLEDYSFLIDGLAELYQVTFDPRWLAVARELADSMVERFRAPDGGFYDTSDDHETLVLRPRDLQDNATPSGSAMAATALLRLSGLCADTRYVNIACESMAGMQELTRSYPIAFGQWLIALEHALSPTTEIAIIGDLAGNDTRALLDCCTAGYRPHQVLAVGTPELSSGRVPLLEGRARVDGRATAYVCHRSVCLAPVTSPELLGEILLKERNHAS